MIKKYGKHFRTQRFFQVATLLCSTDATIRYSDPLNRMCRRGFAEDSFFLAVTTGTTQIGYRILHNHDHTPLHPN